ncbi:hypothetical protein MJO29_015959 [Puccinia striiformis f. sp. tritici]|nr:hypothetical protein MJO29_015959 [Puccinia striiformis f. sp. tritici]
MCTGGDFPPGLPGRFETRRGSSGRANYCRAKMAEREPPKDSGREPGLPQSRRFPSQRALRGQLHEEKSHGACAAKARLRRLEGSTDIKPAHLHFSLSSNGQVAP